ncbi:MAG: WD40 repeat domain-containing protein [Acidobacteria bacterium]|nr:WD40 repeat domain-containing protein [Acidobacteriota bacterium]
MTGSILQLDLKARDLTCAFNADRTRAVTGVIGLTARIWDTATGELIRELAGHTNRIWGVAWNGSRILTGSRDATARLWNADTGECLHVLEGHTAFVRSAEFSGGDGAYAITGSQDRDTRVWDLATGACLRTFSGHLDSAYCGVVTTDGAQAISGSRDGTLRVWNVATGEAVRVIEAHQYHVQHLAWGGPREDRVASCSQHIALWDVAAGECLQAFEGHQETIRSVEFTADYTRLVSACHDRTVKVWDVASGKCLDTYKGKSLFVMASWLPGEGSVIAADEQARLYRF